MKRYVLLSFDVEEFDMPLEYGHAISPEEQMRVGRAGLNAITPLLDDPSIAATLFTTANFAQHYPEVIRTLAQKHEIASHTFYHSDFENEHLLRSRITLEKISGTPVTGLRMPRMRPVEMSAVKVAGYNYDSSINPTWIPGRYNNFHLPRTVYTDQGMTRIPASVSPLIRVPLFWLSFKNFPYPLFKALVMQTIKTDGYVNLYFHPWEFTDISGYGLPRYTRQPQGKELLNRLKQLVLDLKNAGADFITIDSYLRAMKHIVA